MEVISFPTISLADNGAFGLFGGFHDPKTRLPMFA
jgi:hypothetical protein